MKEVVLEGISISVTKKSIKNMYIRVVPPDGEVRITAPYAVSDAYIRRFAMSKISWIKKQQKYFQEQPYQIKGQYIVGENCYLWGRRYCLDVQHSGNGNRIYLSGEKLVLQMGEESSPQKRESVLNEWYREQMRQVIPDILKKCENIVGVQANEWRIKNMRTRWGTCNIEKKRIWLNLQLAKKPMECLEYVIVHELVHLLERRHNERFYGYMDQFYPNWREVKYNLNHEI